MPNVKNFSYSSVLTAPSPASSGTSLVVQSGDGAKFPSVSFNATIWPAGVRPTSSNAEVVTVTNISTDTFTITRAQESSGARTVIVGDQIAATITGALFPTGTVVGTTDAQTVSGKVLSDTFMGKNFDTRVTKQSTTLEASTDYLVDDILEVAASHVLEIPATSTLEVTPIVKQSEAQSYFAFYDTVESGCVWTADAAASTLLATMTDGYVWINGRRLRVNCVRSRTFTASKDTYVDFSDNGDGTAKITYTETTNNAAAGSPTLAAGSLRNAIIVSGASAIAAATSINQGQESMIVPLVVTAFAVTDSLGNLICPRDPQRRLLGYRQILAAVTGITSTTGAQVVGLSCPVIVPSNRKVKVTFFTRGVYISTAVAQAKMQLWDGTVGTGTQIGDAESNPAATLQPNSVNLEAIVTPSSSSKTYNAAVATSAGADAVNVDAAATAPSFIKVELI